MRFKTRNVTLLTKRLTPRHTRWFFSTDLIKPERDQHGDVFDTGYLILHSLGYQLAIYWNR